ncbi:riboflavin synthase subunit alpha [Aidingimonas halophila]|uniref:Riboflavin synthase n=1 Tax=Aidingimonas halophila TaxID=574349 RepID=A0A1H3B117_9GAMM|nr:riboflavin synthase subunit alpha [Aidingimonas halophila]GHC25715.1 riboflavin synthase subunit alpha [Aidingimonas halophila]SDX35617.1 riboflavin synthase alpha chain [Aidingimonas halophila]
MFTGIVQGTAEIVSVIDDEAFRTHVVRLDDSLLEGLKPGASVSHNGVCLTVTSVDGNDVSFDLMRETLRVSNLGALGVGDRVNIERAARFGDEIGGHAMSGHVSCMATLVEVNKTPNNLRLWFEVPDEQGRFVFDKGYIGVDGISLTVGEVVASKQGRIRFCVNLIPETLQRTTLGDRRVNDHVNIEIDPQTQAVVETVERVLASQRGMERK